MGREEVWEGVLRLLDENTIIQCLMSLAWPLFREMYNEETAYCLSQYTGSSDYRLLDITSGGGIGLSGMIVAWELRLDESRLLLVPSSKVTVGL